VRSHRDRRERRTDAADIRYARDVELLVRRQYRLIGAANVAARLGADRLVLLSSPTGDATTVLMDSAGVLSDLADYAPRLTEFVRRCARGVLDPGEVLSVEPLAGLA
jgi:uncharacterized protein RhaS with RHS repeats